MASLWTWDGAQPEGPDTSLIIPASAAHRERAIPLFYKLPDVQYRITIRGVHSFTIRIHPTTYVRLGRTR